jgi:hypothetical protein
MREDPLDMNLGRGHQGVQEQPIPACIEAGIRHWFMRASRGAPHGPTGRSALAIEMQHGWQTVERLVVTGARKVEQVDVAAALVRPVPVSIPTASRG